jgi:hypothetical protein
MPASRLYSAFVHLPHRSNTDIRENTKRSWIKEGKNGEKCTCTAETLFEYT